MCGSDRNGGALQHLQCRQCPQRSLCSGVRTHLIILLLQGHGDQQPTTLNLLPGCLAIPCLAITTLVLVKLLCISFYGFSIALCADDLFPQSHRVGCWVSSRPWTFRKNPEAPAVEGQASGQRHIQPHRQNANKKKKAPKSQGHIWLAFAVTKLAPLASEDSSGSWQRTALAEPEPAGVGASCAKVLCLLAPLPAQS